MTRSIWINILLLMAFQAHARSNIGVSFTNYQELNTPQNSDYANNWLKLSYQGESSLGRGWKGELGLDIQYGVRNRYFLYSAPKANISFEGQNTSFLLGRQELDWNLSERFWGMNAINPQRGFSLIDGKTEGLVGLKLAGRWEGFGLEFFASPFYVPQMNPNYDISVPGEVKTKSIWLRPPQTTVVFNGVVTPVHYTVEKPKIKDVLLQESIALKLAKRWDGGELGVYGLYKPENKIRINATGFYNQDTIGAELAEVRAKPFVNHHSVYGLGLRQRLGDFKFVGGVETNSPEKGDDPTFIFDIADFKPVYIKRTYIHSLVEYEREGVSMSLYYLHLVSEKGKSGKDYFSENSPWSRAGGFELFYKVNDFLQYHLNSRHDFKWKDTLTINELFYNYNKNLGMGLGLELLESASDESYWSYFRSNDRYYVSFLINY